MFVLLTAILLRWLKISPPLSRPCPLTGVTGVWYDRIHDGSVGPPMLFVSSLDSHLTRLKIAPPPSRPCPLTGVTGVWYDRIYECNVAAPMLFVLLTAILLGLKLINLPGCVLRGHGCRVVTLASHLRPGFVSKWESW